MAYEDENPRQYHAPVLSSKQNQWTLKVYSDDPESHSVLILTRPTKREVFFEFDDLWTALSPKERKPFTRWELTHEIV